VFDENSKENFKWRRFEFIVNTKINKKSLTYKTKITIIRIKRKKKSLILLSDFLIY
jgi:hypothetical protein